MSSPRWLLGAFLLLQSADVVLTWRLLTARPDVGEANPVAVAVLDRHGWGGAAALKLASTSVALGCVLLIGRRRPAFGRALLGGACALLLAVVAYSASLLARPEGADVAWLARSRREAAALDEQRAALNELSARRDAICAGLAAGRLTLPEAVGGMTANLREYQGRLSQKTRENWPCSGRPALIAVYLVRHCDSDRRRAPGLRDQLARHYPEAAE